MRHTVKKWVQEVKDYFTFTASEKRGINVLVGILILVIVANYCCSFFTKEAIDFTAFDAELKLLQKHEIKQTFIDKDTLSEVKRVQKSDTSLKPFYFDPNTISLSQWLALGLSQKQAAVIIKYRDKGGHFTTASDFRKIFTITDAQHQALAPFIKIIQKRSDTVIAYSEIKSKEIKQVEINTATISQLEALPGIGVYLAKSIVEYRTKLGGFVNAKQLTEVYSFTDSLYNVLKNYLLVDKQYVNQININSNISKDLQHPYLPYDARKRAMAYSKMHGQIDSEQKLYNALQLDDSSYARLKPYINFK
jgi:competence protein ComEA